MRFGTEGSGPGCFLRFWVQGAGGVANPVLVLTLTNFVWEDSKTKALSAVVLSSQSACGSSVFWGASEVVPRQIKPNGMGVRELSGKESGIGFANRLFKGFLQELQTEGFREPGFQTPSHRGAPKYPPPIFGVPLFLRVLPRQFQPQKWKLPLSKKGLATSNLQVL